MKCDEHWVKSLWQTQQTPGVSGSEKFQQINVSQSIFQPAVQKVFKTPSKFILELISQQDLVKTKKITSQLKNQKFTSQINMGLWNRYFVERFRWVFCSLNFNHRLV